jgi:hypothetical protein
MTRLWQRNLGQGSGYGESDAEVRSAKPNPGSLQVSEYDTRRTRRSRVIQGHGSGEKTVIHHLAAIIR